MKPTRGNNSPKWNSTFATTRRANWPPSREALCSGLQPWLAEFLHELAIFPKGEYVSRQLELSRYRDGWSAAHIASAFNLPIAEVTSWNHSWTLLKTTQKIRFQENQQFATDRSGITSSPRLANGSPLTIDHLLADLCRVARRTRCSSALLRSFVRQSGLSALFSP